MGPMYRGSHVVEHVYQRTPCTGEEYSMIATVLSGAILGLDAYVVEVEVDVASRGLPRFSIVGLPEEAIRESKDRVKTAILNAGYRFPSRRITVNLAPANRKKEGTAFDLPIALGILAATTGLGKDLMKRFLFVGELSLDGQVKSVRGALPLALSAYTMGLEGIVVPLPNAREAGVVTHIKIMSVQSLAMAVEFLSGNLILPHHSVDITALFETRVNSTLDLSDVKGQSLAKRAIEIAAAGGHNILFIGPPGSGKTMLARRIPTVLPPMTLEEALETTKIYSVAGQLPHDKPLLTQRPFRSPHHNVSDAGLIGGGAIPRPGEISLSHNGVLFLDELTEFRKNVLELLRQPLEEGELTIARSAVSLTFPARMMFIGAMNPCPCGYLGDPGHSCMCTPLQIQRYRSKLSGPLIDRIDLHVEVPRVPYKELALQEADTVDSMRIQIRVCQARKIQQDRFHGQAISCNAQMGSRDIHVHCQTGTEGMNLLERAVEGLGFSARAYSRILKVARSIADLDGSPSLATHHVAEAIQYRVLDRQIHPS